MLGFSGLAGGPGGAVRAGVGRFQFRTLGAGTFRGPALGRHDAGASPLAGRTSRASRPQPAAPEGAGPRGGCSRGRVRDSCARSIPAPARPAAPAAAAAPSNPHCSRAAPPAALSANIALVCAGGPPSWAFAGRRDVCVSLGPRVLVPSPAGPGVTRTQLEEGLPPPTASHYTLGWAVDPDAEEPQGAPTSVPASVSPSGE